jgi:hypothetical protein
MTFAEERSAIERLLHRSRLLDSAWTQVARLNHAVRRAYVKTGYCPLCEATTHNAHCLLLG